MQKRVITFLLFCFIKNILSFSAARTVDPISLALEQILSELTFEIVPCPTYPNTCATCSNVYDAPNQCGGYNPNICSNYYDAPNQYLGCNPNIYPTCTNYYDAANQCGGYKQNSYGNPYDQYWQCEMECGSNICNSPYDQYGIPMNPNVCSTCSNYYDAPNQCGGYPNVCGNPYDQYWQYGMEYGSNICNSPYDQYGIPNPNICPTCTNTCYDVPNQYGSYSPNIYGNPYNQRCQCGMEYGPNICNSPTPCDQYGMSGWDCIPNICSSPLPYDQCMYDTYPACNCYRDIKNPCSMYEDSSFYICFDSCGCSNMQSSPYIYYPEVEYPKSSMDIRPYFYGSCWCS